MDWQLTISLLIVAAAAVALVRRAIGVIQGEGEGSCGGCSKNCGEPNEAATDPEVVGFVPEDQITIRYEEESA
mgnify:CR=1 FL=1|jgi:hypothetical protein